MKKNDISISFDKSFINAIILLIIAGLCTLTIAWNSSFVILTAIASGYWGYTIGKKILPKP